MSRLQKAVSAAPDREQLKFVQGIQNGRKYDEVSNGLMLSEKAIEQAIAAGKVPLELEEILTSLLEECYERKLR